MPEIKREEFTRELAQDYFEKYLRGIQAIRFPGTMHGTVSTVVRLMMRCPITDYYVEVVGTISLIGRNNPNRKYPQYPDYKKHFLVNVIARYCGKPDCSILDRWNFNVLIRPEEQG